jgi:exosortase K
VHINKNIPYYITSVGIFILLKVGFTYANNDDLSFLLKPTDKFIGLLTGSQSTYLSEYGFFYEKLNILIEKSCCGFNFWILGFLVFSYLGLRYFDKTSHKILTIPISLLGAYLLTIFVNTSRIFASIVLQSQTSSFISGHQHLVHEAIGIITNLSFLILAYYLIEKLFIQLKHHAKPA